MEIEIEELIEKREEIFNDTYDSEEIGIDELYHRCWILYDSWLRERLVNEDTPKIKA